MKLLQTHHRGQQRFCCILSLTLAMGVLALAGEARAQPNDPASESETTSEDSDGGDRKARERKPEPLSTREEGRARKPVRKKETSSRWYGWQSIPGVVVFTGVMVGGLAKHGDSDDALPYLGVGFVGYWLTTPVVHFVHGNKGRGFLDIVMNVAVPLVGTGIDAAAANDGNAGLFISMMLWSTADIAFLHYEDPPKKSRRRAMWPIESWSIAPTLDARMKGLSIVGQF